MKRAGLVIRRVAKTRLSFLVALAILAAAFMTATTLMKAGGGTLMKAGGGSPGSGSGHSSGEGQTPASRATDAKPSAQAQAGGDIPAFTIPAVAPAVFGGDVRNLPHVAQREIDRPEFPEPPRRKPTPLAGRQLESLNISLVPMPSTIQNFAGITRTDFCTGGQCGAGIPPDTNGDVGPNHYIQAVNSAYAIYDKATGNLLASFTENSLFSGGPTGTICDTNSFGDPVVVYDALADRWVLSNLAFGVSGGTPVSPFYQCIAASRSGNPVTGGWNLYAIRTDTGGLGQPPTNTLNDYPKFGTWSDCLYYSANGFDMSSGGTFNGTEFASFSRSDMYSGLPLTMALGFIANPSDPFGMLPSNLAAPSGSPPPAGTPNYYVSESEVAFAYEVRKFTAGVNCGAGGVLSAATNVSQGSYALSAGSVPQPPPATSSNMLDSLIDRLMQKAQYRRVGGTESLWVVHSVQTSNGSTVRPQWAQLNVTGGVIATSPVQEQIYAPDTTLSRWMGSIAADKQGNVAVGYSTSNATSPNFPSIAYSGRLASDPLNTLPQSETQLVAGSGSQTNNCGGAPCHRWGDYSAMSVDPSDGCTFWYTSEYYVSQTGGNSGTWNTRIGSFKFPACSSGGPTPTNTPTNTPTATPTLAVSPTPTPTPVGLFAVTPCRLIDTRYPVGPYGGPSLVAGASRAFVLAGQCGIPTTARSVALNVTVISPTTGPGFLTVFPAGISLPGTSTINYNQGDIRANNAIVPLGPGGGILVFCGQGSGTADLVIDTVGYFQ